VSTPLRSSLSRRVRHRTGPRINRVARTFSQPTTQVKPDGYVGTAHHPLAEVEETLCDRGFVWDPLSMYHYTPEGNDTDGSWVYRPSPLADRQLHVVLFELDDDRTEVYAHDEFSWVRHPVYHSQEVDIRRDRASDAVREWFDAEELTYEYEPKPVRKLGHAVERLRTRLTQAAGSYLDRLDPGHRRY
jgi:hypothetical protein